MCKMLQMVLVCCSQPLGGCIHPPAIAGLTAPTYNLVQRLANGQLRSSQNLRAALTHRRTEAGSGRPAPFASRQVELRGVVPAPEFPVDLKLLHVTGFSCPILPPAPALQVSPKSTPLESQLIAQIP